MILAVITAFRPDAEHVYGAVFILMAALLGLGHGSVFGWVARAADRRTLVRCPVWLLLLALWVVSSRRW